MHLKKTGEDWAVDIVVWTLLAIVFILTVYPFYYVLVASFNEGYDLMKGGVYFWPRRPTLANYAQFLSKRDWIRSIWVSLFRTIAGTALTLSFTSLVSYTLSRRDLVFGKTYRFLFVFSMYVTGGLIPYYVTLRNLNLLNKLWVYIIPTMLNLFFVLVGTSFFRGIPDSLLESAKLDGASEIRTFLQIVLPVSVPFLATLALFAAVGQWNSWLDSTYYVNDEKLRTLAYRMMAEINKSSAVSATGTGGSELDSSVTVTSLQSTAMVISMLPIMCVYPFLQKHFVHGIMIGAVKE